MPHECTDCGKGFPDGSKEMLGGCPSCGGKEFQFRPKRGTLETTENDAQSAARSEMAATDTLPTGTVGADRGTEAAPAEATVEPVGDDPEPADEERPPSDLEELRARLDDQFESIRIVEPGQYELNLMELYDRDTYIISLQEDGRYVIDVPEAWRSDAADT